MKQFRIAARTLAETMLKSGDLSFSRSAVNRMLEGAEGHRYLQADTLAQNEVSLACTVEQDGLSLTVHGRIDRLYEGPIIEEIKTTWRDASSFGADEYPLHWAQAYIYGHMYLQRYGGQSVAIRLCYLNLQDRSITRMTREKTKDELQAFFFSLVEPYMARLKEKLAHELALQEEIAGMAFPYAGFRAGQRELAAQVYTALSQGEQLLVQAPTGTGKTMGVLFPALKALGQGAVERLFYLSARGTGRAAAVDALQTLGLGQLKAAEINAKAKICPFAATRCLEGCECALGYYDRVDSAIADILSTPSPYGFAQIRAFAAKHRLCPFEFSLDLSLECDVILCDYNYVFDPAVKLQRFFSFGRQPIALLVDEAHNLPSRALSMYSATLELKPFDALRKSIPRGPERKRPLYLQLRGFIKAVSEECNQDEDPPFAKAALPASLPLAKELLATLQEDAHCDPALLAECTLQLSGFLRCAQGFDEEYVTLYEGGKTTRQLRLFCRDASKKLQECLKKVASAVLFSATLTPPSFYQGLSGLSPDAPSYHLPSPFPPENLLCMHLPLNTRFRFREQTLPAVAASVAAFCSGQPQGNYFVFCPSYAYLRMLEAELPLLLPQAEILIQRREMDDMQREEYLASLDEEQSGVRIALAVLGGVFAEAIDLPGKRMSGAVVIGVGLPQFDLENELLRARYDESYGDGYAYAYLYPGLCRVLQAAGRVIRTETDRGAILLIDDRYGAHPYPQLLPPHWQIRQVRDSAQIQAQLRRFW